MARWGPETTNEIMDFFSENEDVGAENPILAKLARRLLKEIIRWIEGHRPTEELSRVNSAAAAAAPAQNPAPALAPAPAGKFTRKEIKQIKRNWMDFQNEFGRMDELLFLNYKEPGPWKSIPAHTLRMFKKYIARDIPGHTVQSIYTKWTTTCVFRKTGRVSPDECTLLQVLLARKKFQLLTEARKEIVVSLALDRPRRAVRRLLAAEDSSDGRVSWTVNLESKLLRNLISTESLSGPTDLSRPITHEAWHAIARQMGLPAKTLHDRWHFHLLPAILRKEWCSRAQLQIKLIKKLKRKLDNGTYNDWKQVNWEDWARQMNSTSLFLYRTVMTMRWNYLKEHSIKERRHFQKSVNVLAGRIKDIQKNNENKKKKKFLRRLQVDWRKRRVVELKAPDQE